MSATGRGAERHEADFYSTPREAFAPLLQHLPTNVVYWEPCCGDGRLVKWLTEAGCQADGADLYPQSPVWPSVDFLADQHPREFVVTNPPFSIAQAIAAHSLDIARETLLLLRLNFLASKKRRDWFRAHEPAALFVLSERPSFAIFARCESDTRPEADRDPEQPTIECGHKWSVPTEAGRPSVCPVCGGTDIQITTSDATDYAWFYFGHRFKGIYHL